MNVQPKLIEILARSALVKNFERAYTAATGMPMMLRPVETWQLPFPGKRNENSFCALIAVNSHACAVCLQLQQKLGQDAMNQPAIRTCAYGLCEMAVPVKLGEQTIGFLQTGQVMRRKPSAASFHRAVAQARKRGVDIDNAPMKQAYFATPVASPEKLDSASGLLAIFADHLSLKSNDLTIQSARSEPPFVTKAKQFIREHFAEDLSLRMISSTVNTSRFYFCKQFRKATGLGLTEFVSRTRIEQAKNLLLNRNLRISEIAYAIGFQSLTHFNRAFKKIVGRSPTAHRCLMPVVQH